MSYEDYLAELKVLNQEYENKKRKCQSLYALANNPYNIGDVITDHMCSIRIEKIETFVSYSTEKFGMPSCVYTGMELKKDGTPKKKGITTQIYQQNINKHLR